MGKRERLEDIGRLTEMLGTMMDSEAFESCRMDDVFVALYKDDEEKLRSLCYQLEALKHNLSDCWALARWGDDDE